VATWPWDGCGKRRGTWNERLKDLVRGVPPGTLYVQEAGGGGGSDVYTHWARAR